MSSFFPLHSHLPQPSPPPTFDPTPLWLCPSVLCTCFLMTLPHFTLLSLPHLPSGYCQSVLYFKYLVIFCLLVYFVGEDPFIGEIIWYLFFINWLISLSIMLSRSTHAVTKGSSSFLLLLSFTVFHCVNVPEFFDPLIY